MSSFNNFFLQLLVQIIAPCLFFLGLWQNNTKNLWLWVLQVLAIGAYILNIFITGFWPFGLGYFWRFIIVVLFLLFTLISYFKVKRSFKFYKIKIQEIPKVLIYLFIFCFFSWGLGMVVSGDKTSENVVHLEFPLKDGTYYISQGGNHFILNHHYTISAQKYALDIHQLNHWGLRANKLIPHELDDYNIFQSLLYSPCDGQIIATVDQCENCIPPNRDPENLAGNYIAIRMKDTDYVIILAHLQKGSILVNQGDMIHKGNPLARIGNSGNTTEPHLHIHCVKNPKEDFFFNGVGIPLVFYNQYLSRNGIITR